MSDLELTSPAGREQAKEAIAKAMGWRFYEHFRHMRTPSWARKDALGYPEIHRSTTPPDYLGDDPARNREMRDALLAGQDCIVTVEFDDDGPDRPIVRVTTGDDMESTGATEAEALVLALYAAGLLETGE